MYVLPSPNHPALLDSFPNPPRAIGQAPTWVLMGGGGAGAAAHCNENFIYLFLFWELCGLSPNLHIHVSVRD